MRKLIYGGLFLALIGIGAFGFVGCEKEEVKRKIENSENEKVELKINLKSNNNNQETYTWNGRSCPKDKRGGCAPPIIVKPSIIQTINTESLDINNLELLSEIFSTKTIENIKKGYLNITIFENEEDETTYLLLKNLRGKLIKVFPLKR